MTQIEASANFTALMNVLTEQNPTNRSQYVSCMVLLPTIKTDLQFLFQYFRYAEDVIYAEKVLLIIDELFNEKKKFEKENETKLDWQFTTDKLLRYLQNFLCIQFHLSNLQNYRRYSHLIKLLISLFPRGTDPNSIIPQVQSWRIDPFNRQVIFAAFCHFFKDLLPQTLQIIIQRDLGHFRNPISIFAYADVLYEYGKKSNIPYEFISYIAESNLINGLESHSEPPPETTEIPKNCIEEKSQNEFVLYLLLKIQKFYEPSVVMFIDQEFFNQVIIGGIVSSDYTRNLVSEIMEVMPADNSNSNFNIESQISALLVPSSQYMTDFDSDYSKRIRKFAYQRKESPIFKDTLLRLPLTPKRYMSAIYIGFETNFFANMDFFQNCFPANCKFEFIDYVCKAICFLAPKDLFNANNIESILTTLFSICSSYILKNPENVLNTFKTLYNDFSEFIFNTLLKKLHLIQSNMICKLIKLFLNNEHPYTNQSFTIFESESSCNLYLNAVAVICKYCESYFKTNEEKLILFNYLNLLTNSELIEPPTDHQDQFFDRFQQEFTIIGVIKKYVYKLIPNYKIEAKIPKSTDQLMIDFTNIAETLFRMDQTFSIVVAACPKSKSINDASNYIDINERELFQNIQESERQKILDFNDWLFITFYKTRMKINPMQVLTHVQQLISEMKKKRKRMQKAMVTLLAMICKETHSTDFPSDSNNIFQLLGKLVEDSLPLNDLTVWEQVQYETKDCVLQAALNHDVILTESFIKKMISYPFFSIAFAPLLMKMKSKSDYDAKLTAISWVEHLDSHNYHKALNDEISRGIISTIENNQTIVVASIIASLLPQIEKHNQTDVLPILDFAQCLVNNGLKEARNDCSIDPSIIMTFAKFCYSKYDEVRISAFKFIIAFFRISKSSFENDENNVLHYFEYKHTKGDRQLAFITLFNKVFEQRRQVAQKVFEKVANLKLRYMYHILLCKSIIESNLGMSELEIQQLTKPIMPITPVYQAIQPIISPTIIPSYINPNYLNQQNPNFMNPYLVNPNSPQQNPNLLNQNLLNQNLLNQNVINPNLVNQNVMNQNNLVNKNDVDDFELIPDEVLLKFTQNSFRSSKVSYEAQEVLKYIALKNMTKFTYFLMHNKLTEFTSCALRRIMYTTAARELFIDTFILYIQRGCRKFGSMESIKEHELVITEQEIQLLTFITTSDTSGELNSLNCPKLLLIIIMLIGISYAGRKRKNLKNNKELPQIFNMIIKNTQINTKQVAKPSLVTSFNTDDYLCFNESLQQIAVALQNLNDSNFYNFCAYCKRTVENGIDAVICSIGVLMIQLSIAFSDYVSYTPKMMRNELWNIACKAMNRSNMKVRRLFAFVLNKVIIKPHLKFISKFNISHIFTCLLESLSVELDDFKFDTVEMICMLSEFALNQDNKKLFIANLQKVFHITKEEKQKKDKPKDEGFLSIFKFNKNESNEENDIDLSVEEYSSRIQKKLRINAHVLKALNFAVAKRESSDRLFFIFGDYHLTKLNVVDVAEIAIKGNLEEQNLTFQLFKNLMKVQQNEEVIKKFITDMTEEEFHTFCSRLINVDPTKVDKEWMKALIWIGQSFKRRNIPIFPPFKDGVFKLSIDILLVDGHPCQELAAQAMKEFI